MAKDHIILTKQEADAVDNAIRNDSNGVLDKFKYGGWTVDANAGRLKDGSRAMSRELVEEIQRRGGGDATIMGGVDLKNRPDHNIKDSDREL